MSIIDKIGRRPDEVIEHDNGDITYRFGTNTFRYAVDGVYVKCLNEGEINSEGLECRLNEDDSIEQYQWATGWAWLAKSGDEPLFEIGRHLVETGGDVTPSGRGANNPENEGMTIWFEIPKVWASFKMAKDGLIEMEDCFTGDVYVSQTIDGALDRLTWLIERTGDDELWEAIRQGKEEVEARYAELFGKDEEEEEE